MDYRKTNGDCKEWNILKPTEVHTLANRPLLCTEPAFKKINPSVTYTFFKKIFAINVLFSFNLS